ncbi:MAG: hypothetical protein IT500_15960 [Rubrivivax sp.]|nr:hypothetical protein [Rubrivivax sp.]
MQALREILIRSGNTVVIHLPEAFRAKRMEVIVLDADAPESDACSASASGSPPRRRPSPLLAGTRIVGDIMSPAVAPADWNVLE